MLRSAFAGVVVCACAIHTEAIVEPTQSRAVASTCIDEPIVRVGNFRHATNRTFSRFGSPRHRGYDLIAVESDEKQTLGGKFAYSRADKDLEDEQVQVFACVDSKWEKLGTTSTDNQGRFSLELAGDERLPPGIRDLFAVAPGDGSGVRFLAYVARAGESVIVTDLDGTVTESEKAMFRTVAFGDDIAHRLGAPQAFAASGKTIVYVSSRGDFLTNVTREWLREHGFPPGPLRLARPFATKPGGKTIALKTTILREIPVPIHAAIGNRATDVAAYTNAGVPASKIFVKLPEFEHEVAADLAARRAVGFTTYQSLAPYLR
jgi:phosphatidate phosphatase PAH1